MSPVPDEIVPIESSDDVIRVRQVVRQWTIREGFSLVDQTKLVTAASELARNTYEHGGGGAMRLEHLNGPGRPGLRLTFTDQGPGIPSIADALRDGYSTGRGMGLGLGGARRLVNEFDIESAPGRGTRVTITRWA
jgi:serine/threonine-protein kinase RsbT